MIPAPAVNVVVGEVARSVASDIATLGHYQGRSGQTRPYTDRSGPCCVVSCPTRSRVGADVFSAYTTALVRRVGIKDLVAWNDGTPTERVLAELDGLAAMAGAA